MKTLRHFVAVASLLAGASTTTAEDIDLFLGIQGTQPQAANVLLVLDNAANFENSTGEIAGSACNSAVYQSKIDKDISGANNDGDTGNRCTNCNTISLSLPGNFSAVRNDDESVVLLSWLDIAGETQYEIQWRKLQGQSWPAWSETQSTLIALSNRVDLFHGPGTGTYEYRIRAVKASQPRAKSEWAYSAQVILTANFSGNVSLHTTGSIEQCAIYNVIKGLPAGRVRVGIMVYNEGGVEPQHETTCYSSGGANKGGCLVYPMTLIDDGGQPGSTNTRQQLLDYVKDWVNDGSTPGKRLKGNAQATASTMQEAWAYLSASATDPRRGLSGRLYSQSPVTASACTTQSYVVFIGNSWKVSSTPGDSSQSPDVALRQLLSSGVTTDMHPTPRGLQNQNPGAYDQMTSLITETRVTNCLNNNGTKKDHSFSNNQSTHTSGGEYADEWARYMRENAGIVTYSVGLVNPQTCAPQYPALLGSMAERGGGRYFEVNNYEGLVTSLTEVFSSILAVNSVFASVSLPISVNNQDTYLNQVYIGMFRPDAETEPRWSGNLKQYQLGFVEGSGEQQIELKDADGDSALSSSGTGFIDACARSLWTPGSTDAYWPDTEEFENCVGVSARSNSPDGPIVEKGAAGYQLRALTTLATRNLWTCGATCDSIVPFTETATGPLANSALLSACADTTKAECAAQNRNTLIAWQRGLNNRTDDTADNFSTPPAVSPVPVRPSAHGDVVHSRPRAINFGPKENPRIVVFYGANDGILRAVNGNRTGTIAGKAPGGEIWSFMPREFEDEIARMRMNYPLVKFRGLNEQAGRSKPYGFDGPVSAWIEQTSTAVTKAVIFASMRRGGRMVYAFDVQGIAPGPDASGNIPASQNPTLKWRFGCDDAGSCTNGAGSLDNDLAQEIGQTWSAPQLVKTQTGTYIVMGGGYDPCEDVDSLTDPCSGGSAAGRRVFILDAETGEQVKEFTTSRSVAADVFVVPQRVGAAETGFANHLYVTDLGGNIYRITGPGRSQLGNPADWEMTPIARFGCDAGLGSGCNRKFFYAPDVLSTSYGYALLVGTGDREKPLPDYASATQIQNYFFMVKDNLTNPLWLCPDKAAGTSCSGNDYIEFTDLAAVDPNAQVAPAALSLPANRGWYLPLATKEQVVTSALTVFGVTVFSTHTPNNSGDTCSPNLGIAQAYQVLYESALGAVTNDDGSTQRSQRVDGGGLPPSPVAGQVEIDGKVVAFVIGAASRSALEARVPNLAALPKQPKGRRYWYVER